MSNKQNRKLLRLPDYDYSSAGAYFITICAFQKQNIFGKVMDGNVKLSPFGQIVKDEWIKTEDIRPDILLDEFVIMPDHFHAILFFTEPDISHVGAHSCAPLHEDTVNAILYRQPRSLGSLIAGFKSSVTCKINTHRGTPGVKVWQRNYYEHIIRDEEDLNQIRDYILHNPMK